jgi:hypothetical protein
MTICAGSAPLRARRWLPVCWCSRQRGAILDFVDCNGEREGMVQAVASSSKTGGLAKTELFVCMRKQIV